MASVVQEGAQSSFAPPSPSPSQSFESVSYTFKQKQQVVVIQSLFRRHASIKAKKLLQKKSNYRTKIVQEILETEKSYVHSLRVLVGVYLNPLRSSLAGYPTYIGYEDLKSIFSNVEALLGINSTLLENLKERVNAWDHTQCVGDVFLEMTPYLKMYTQYCNNYETALQTVERVKASNPEFDRFVQVAASFPESRDLAFMSLLIMPVQRIPRYNLLLMDFVKNTYPDHKDYGLLQRALSQMKEVADHVNQQLKVANSIKEIIRIQNETGWSSTLRSDRCFIDEIKCKIIIPKGTRKIQLHLFSDVLVVSLKDGHEFLGNKYRFFFETTLSGCWCEIIETPVIQTAMHIVGQAKTLTVIFDTVSSRDEWKNKIEDSRNRAIAGSKVPQRLERFEIKVDPKVEQRIKSGLVLSESEGDESGASQLGIPTSSSSSSSLPVPGSGALSPTPKKKSKASRVENVTRTTLFGATRSKTRSEKEKASDPLSVDLPQRPSTQFSGVVKPLPRPPTNYSSPVVTMANIPEGRNSSGPPLGPPPSLGSMPRRTTASSGSVARKPLPPVPGNIGISAEAPVGIPVVEVQVPRRPLPKPNLQQMGHSLVSQSSPSIPLAQQASLSSQIADDRPVSSPASSSSGWSSSRQSSVSRATGSMISSGSYRQRRPATSSTPITDASAYFDQPAFDTYLSPSSSSSSSRSTSPSPSVSPSTSNLPSPTTSSPLSPMPSIPSSSSLVASLSTEQNVGIPTSGPPLPAKYKTPSWVRKEGFLKKKGDVNPAWKRRFFRMIDSNVFYYNNQGDVNFLGTIDLKGARLESLAPECDRGLMFALTTMKGRTYILEAENDADFRGWTQVILEEIEGLIRVSSR